MLECSMKRGNSSTYSSLTLLQGKTIIYYIILGCQMSKSRINFALLVHAVLYGGTPEVPG